MQDKKDALSRELNDELNEEENGDLNKSLTDRLGGSIKKEQKPVKEKKEKKPRKPREPKDPFAKKSPAKKVYYPHLKFHNE